MRVTRDNANELIASGALPEGDLVFHVRSGAEALPLILVDGEVAVAGRYPRRAELARWAGLRGLALEVKSAESCCSGSKCC